MPAEGVRGARETDYPDIRGLLLSVWSNPNDELGIWDFVVANDPAFDLTAGPPCAALFTTWPPPEGPWPCSTGDRSSTLASVAPRASRRSGRSYLWRRTGRMGQAECLGAAGGSPPLRMKVAPGEALARLRADFPRLYPKYSEAPYYFWF